MQPNISLNLTRYGKRPAPGYAFVFIVTAPGAGRLVRTL